MARAFLPSAGLARDGSFPLLVLRWAGLRIDPGHLAAIRRATGLAVEGGVSLLYPHVLGFRLQMAVLTHPAFPLPIWTALQVRNRLVRHRRIDSDATFDLETRVGAHRLVEKGVEVDLLSCLSRGSERCWESNITYFYRGRYEGERTEAARAASPDLSATSVVDQFHMPKGGGRTFGRLTGDYNGIHIWSWYARRLGFRDAFSHPAARSRVVPGAPSGAAIGCADARSVDQGAGVLRRGGGSERGQRRWRTSVRAGARRRPPHGHRGSMAWRI